MKLNAREVAAAVAPAVVLALWAGGGAAAFMATLEPAERSALLAMLESRMALIVMGWMVASIALGALAHRLWTGSVAATGRVAEQAQVLVSSDVQRELAVPGGTEVLAVQAVINQLVKQRGALKAEIDERVRAGSRDIDTERARLAALMAELTQSVVVCNLDGRVLLYNARARLQFRALSESAAGGAELLGIGRSIYGVFDRQLVAHALDSVQQRLQRGAANPSTQFVTSTRGGQLLRVQMAPVRAIGDEAAPTDAITGFVLMLDNITRDFADESERDRLLHQLTESSRASLGNLQAAVELLDDPELDADTRGRFQPWCATRWRR